jgi:hypothetical protein
VAAEHQEVGEPVRLPVRDDIAAHCRSGVGRPGPIEELLDILAAARTAQVRPDLGIGQHLDDPLAVSVPHLAQHQPT